MPDFKPLAAALIGAALTLAMPAVAGAQTDLRHWYFAEGSTNRIANFAFEEEILVGNPSGSPASVTLRFLPAGGGAPIIGTTVVPAFSRQGINVRQFVPSGDVALEVISDVAIVVERTMYWGQGLFNFGPGYYGAGPITDLRAGHNMLGVNAPQLRWMFAEGAIGGPVAFQTFVLLSNPSATDTATVHVHFLTNFGERITEAVTLGPGTRQTVWANDVVPRQVGRQRADFAIDVESVNGVPIVAERSMYWNQGFYGGHAAAGVQASPLWYFAEGAQGGPAGFDTYLLLYNPSTTETIDVIVDFFTAAGLSKIVVESVPPASRRNVYAGSYPTELAGSDKAFAMRVASTKNQPFVAERAMYWRGLREGSASAGVTTAARKWGFADGQQGGFAQFQDPADPSARPFSTYYLILNPTAQPVTVRGVFYVEPAAGEGTAAGAETTLQIAPLSRATFSPASLPALHNRKFAAFFEASGPIIAERAVYWGEGIQGGHASAGAILPDSTPTLAAPTPTAPPTLTGITPNRGNPGGGTVATITGTGLGLLSWDGGQTTLAFGITPVPAGNITVLNANTIRVVTPPSGRGLSSVLVNTRGVALELVGAFEFVDPFLAGPPITFGDQFGTVSQVAAVRPGELQNSCATNTFMFEVVAELRRRTGSNRWGLNWKRGNIGDLSQDIVDYYAGPEGTSMNNSSSVRIYDIIGGHCGGRPSPFWVDQTGATRAAGTIGRWTVEPICRVSRFRDAQYPNGTWLFPECR